MSGGLNVLYTLQTVRSARKMITTDQLDTGSFGGLFLLQHLDLSIYACTCYSKRELGAKCLVVDRSVPLSFMN